VTHPIYHNRSVAAFLSISRDAEANSLAIHQWLDATKELFADARHRSLRHHTQGVACAIKIFGKEGPLAPGIVRDLAILHILEDCRGELPTIDDWAAQIQVAPWMYARHSKDEILASCRRRCGGRAADYESIFTFFAAHLYQSTISRGYLRLHAQGIFEAERRFGESFVNSEGGVVPVRYASEVCVRGLVSLRGRIPSVSDWLNAMSWRPWMNRPLGLTPEIFKRAVEIYNGKGRSPIASENKERGDRGRSD
jgi:hypothetical protein